MTNFKSDLFVSLKGHEGASLAPEWRPRQAVDGAPVNCQRAASFAVTVAIVVSFGKRMRV